MKAIETSYKGYRFRSRLEARWAVFFDVLNLRWEYEPEGFELGGGVRYLPDFWLPESRLWVEVKPAPLSEQERTKAELLGRARHADGKGPARGFVTEGDPAADAGSLYVPWARDSWRSTSATKFGWSRGAEVPGQIGSPPVPRNEVPAAVAAARAARFEFGESGAPVGVGYLDEFEAIAKGCR